MTDGCAYADFLEIFFDGKKLSFTRARVIMMNMKMQMTTAFSLALALTAGVAGGISTQAAAEPAAELPAITAENAELVLPAAYEQYLPLQNPTYMAMSERHIAVADNTDLYIYDEQTERYSPYGAAALTNGASISKIQITDDERLFFSAGGRLFEYSFAEGEAELVSEVPCSTFLIEGNVFYAVSMSDNKVYLSRYSLDNLTRDGETPIRDTVSSIVSKLTAADGKLYCVRDNTHIVTYDIGAATPAPVGDLQFLDSKVGQIADLQFACAYGGYLYYTVNGSSASYKSGLYRTDFNGHAECLIEESGFTAINSYRGELYCIRGKSILKLNITENGASFSDYEIASSSASENRLSGAVASARARNLLVTADKGNNRVSVYDYKTNAHSVIACKDELGHVYAPELVATDGEIIACANGNNVYVYEKKNGAFALSYASRPNNIIAGIACVYGKCYFVTKGFGYGVASPDFSQEQVCVRDDVSQEQPPAALANDLYGNLYVARVDGELYRYTEDNFTDKAAAPLGEKQEFELPAGFKSFCADFEGNLYCLAGSKLYRNGREFAQIDASSFVYRAAGDSYEPVSFALGFEDNKIVFQFGDFMIQTEALDFPSLNKISAEDIYDTLFAEQSGVPELVDIRAGAIAVRTDLAAFRAEEPESFPYASYTRTETDCRGILLAQTEKYSLVALFERNNAFTVNLLPNGSCTPVADSSEYWTETNAVRYTSNAVHAYYFPCIEGALTDDGYLLSRAQKVTLLGTVNNGDYPAFPYALVSFQTEAGEKRGFVPLSYLTEVAPLPPVGEYKLGYIKAGAQGFLSEAGEALEITERTRAEIAENGDGTYTARITKDGVVYTAHALSADCIENPESDAGRISTIVILSVVAVLIIGAYVYLLPRKGKN